MAGSVLSFVGFPALPARPVAIDKLLDVEHFVAVKRIKRKNKASKEAGRLERGSQQTKLGIAQCGSALIWNSEPPNLRKSTQSWPARNLGISRKLGPRSTASSSACTPSSELPITWQLVAPNLYLCARRKGTAWFGLIPFIMVLYFRDL